MVYDLTIDNENDEESVQGLAFNGIIDCEFNFGLGFWIYTFKITGFNTIGIILKDIFFANNSFSGQAELFFFDISIFYYNVGCAIFFKENSSVLFRGNYNSGFCFSKFFFHYHYIHI